MEPMDIVHGISTIKVEDQETSSSSTGYSDTSNTSTLEFSSPASHNFSSPIHAGHDGCYQRQVPHGFDAWSPRDEHFAQLFHSWERLPLSPDTNWEEKVIVLRALEDIIVPFERAICNSDEAFAVWRYRHQAAMETGLSPVPGWPQLHSAGGGWLDEKWNERYCYLVNQREKLLAWRLRSHHAGYLSRGSPVSRPRRITIRRMKTAQNCGNSSLPQFWAQHVDEFLTTEAERHGMEAQTIISAFWTQPPFEEIPALAMSSDSELSSPPSVQRAPTYDQARTRCETPTPTTRVRKVHPEVIKIESDSE